ncbi:MAG: glycosyltransferase [Desulfovibrio sp.]|uniref:glycosyltransferase n=1 Tax=Desulfovibrio sp. TaxID=885 RepID=UPI002A35C7F0|nr:glycosyltransferase [Desulfovibrio sp.]MDY0260592.1 glycosyltransferase [Desulfovibrio sp.]
MNTEQCKILHIAESFGGGCLTALSFLTKSLTKNYQHTIVYSNRNETVNNFRDNFHEHVNFIPLNMKLSANPVHIFNTFTALRKIILKTNPHVVHCHSSIAGVFGRIAAKLAGVPSLYTPHAYAFLRSDIGPVARTGIKAIEWGLTKIGDGIAACGDEEYFWALRLAGDKQKVFLARNAIDLAMIDAINGARTPESETNNIQVGTCGRLTNQHGLDWFVHAATSLQAEASWIWVGAKTDSRELPDFVRRTGWVDNKIALSCVASMNIFVHPTRWDGLSYALLEAMSLHKPVVVSDIPPNRAVVQHGINGFVAKNADEMEQYIRALINDPELRHQMGAAGRHYVEQNHSIDSVRQNYDTIYQNLANSIAR